MGYSTDECSATASDPRMSALDSSSSSASKRMPRRTFLMMSTTSDFLSAVSAGSRVYPHSGMSGAKEGGCGDAFQYLVDSGQKACLYSRIERRSGTLPFFLHACLLKRVIFQIVDHSS